MKDILEKSVIHSDYLSYATSHNVFSPHSNNDLDAITDSFLDNYIMFSSFTPETKNYVKHVVNQREMAITKAGEENRDLQIVNQLSEGVLSRLELFVEQNPTGDIVAETQSILQEPELITLSEDAYTIVCATAATYVDSYNYWKDNITGILNDVATKAGNTFWGYVKRYAIADATAGLETAIGCCLLGPLTLEAVFLGAGIGSAGTCLQDIIEMYQQEKNESNQL